MNWLINLSIKYKISLLSMLGIIGFLTYFVFNYSVTTANAERLVAIESVYYPILEKSDANIVHLDKIKEVLSYAVGVAELEALSESDVLVAKMRENFQQIANLSAEARVTGNELERVLNVYYESARRVTEAMINESSTGSELSQEIERMSETLLTLEEDIKQFRDTTHKQFTSSIEEATRASSQALTVGLVLGIGIVVLLVLSGYLIGSLITRNIANVVVTLREMATGEGDLTKRLNSNSADEIGDLVQWFNVFIDKLHDIISEAVASLDAITMASSELVKGNNDLSERTVEQAASLEETSATMEEMNTAVIQNAESADQCSQLANSSGDLAQRGSQIATQTVTAMGEINKASDQITTIIGVINDIAFQTNLLALNAAVEAARAGEQGRGFAVVATEVRNLAQRSADAAKEIKGLITDSAGKVKVGSDLVDESREALDKITETVKQLLESTSEIAAACKEQAGGVGEVNNAILGLDGITQQNSAAVEEATSASVLMDGQADRLKQLMSFFKVGAQTDVEHRHAPSLLAAEAARPVSAQVAVAKTMSPRAPVRVGHDVTSADEAWEEF